MHQAAAPVLGLAADTHGLLLYGISRRKIARNTRMNDTMSLAERADALEHRMMRELDAIIVKSRLFNLADGDTSTANGPALLAANPGKHMLMGDDPRLPKMPERPTLIDFFK